MNLNKYVGKVVRIDLSNGFYYIGTVEDADEDSIWLIDKNKKSVDINKELITLIREVEK